MLLRFGKSQANKIKRNFKIPFTIFNLHLHRFPFRWKGAARSNSRTNNAGQSVDSVVRCARVRCSAATVPRSILLMSFLAAPGEARSDIHERLAEQRRGRHEEALASVSRELGRIGRVRLAFVIRIGRSAALRSEPNIQEVRPTSLPF